MPALTILGGGPAGLGTAFYAHRAGIPFVLFEKSRELGGLCRTMRYGEHLYDRGAHRFHDRDPEITRDIRELVGDDLISIDAPSKVHGRGRFIDFPPSPLNLLFSSLSLRESGRIAIELLSSRWRRVPVVTFADFAIGQFGKTLARRLLLDYSEKVWGMPADRLSPDVATHRLQGMTLASLFYEIVLPGKKVSHIDGTFLYPRNGYGQIVARLQASLPPGAANVGHEIVGLECYRNRVRRIHFAARPPFDPDSRIISTLPLTKVVKLLGDQLPRHVHEAAARLRFRHIRLLFLRLAQPRVSPNASIYIPGPEFFITRLYEPKNRSARMAPPNETSLVVEIPCFAGDQIHSMDEGDFAARVVHELDQLAIVNPASVIEWRQHFLPDAYPVYSLNYSRAVELIMDGLAAVSNLDMAGRGGRFLYSHLHDQLRFAKDYVKNFSASGQQRSAPPSMRRAASA